MIDNESDPSDSSDNFDTEVAADQSIDIICPAVNVIPVYIRNRPLPPRTHYSNNQPRLLRTLKRDNKALQGLSLPIISNYNVLSSSQAGLLCGRL